MRKSRGPAPLNPRKGRKTEDAAWMWGRFGNLSSDDTGAQEAWVDTSKEEWAHA